MRRDRLPGPACPDRGEYLLPQPPSSTGRCSPPPRRPPRVTRACEGGHARSRASSSSRRMCLTSATLRGRWRRRARTPSPPSTRCPACWWMRRRDAPVLANRGGGISGPALKPIALRCVHEIVSAVSIPVIGTGGVLTGQDAVEMVIRRRALRRCRLRRFLPRGERVHTYPGRAGALAAGARPRPPGGDSRQNTPRAVEGRVTNPPPVPVGERHGWEPAPGPRVS